MTTTKNQTPAQTTSSHTPGRAFDAQRQAQGFRSQEHLDAFYVAYDHQKACSECGKPAPAMWLEGSASWQPTMTVCAEGRRLDELSFSF
jgi:histidinol phosphatase-like enzyme